VAIKGDGGSDKQLVVYAPGEWVNLGDGERLARVLTVMIDETGLDSYEVVWWRDGNRFTAKVAPHEVTSVVLSSRTTKRITIGFHDGN